MHVPRFVQSVQKYVHIPRSVQSVQAIAIAFARTNVPLSSAGTWTLFHQPPLMSCQIRKLSTVNYFLEINQGKA